MPGDKAVVLQGKWKAGMEGRQVAFFRKMCRPEEQGSVRMESAWLPRVHCSPKPDGAFTTFMGHMEPVFQHRLKA